MISCKAMTKILYENSEKSFLEWEKIASRNIFRLFFSANFFMFVLLISNHTVFLVQFEINLHLWVFQKRWNCTRQSGSCNFSFLKNSLVQINSKLNSKQYDYLYLLQCSVYSSFMQWTMEFSKTYHSLRLLLLPRHHISSAPHCLQQHHQCNCFHVFLRISTENRTNKNKTQ